MILYAIRHAEAVELGQNGVSRDEDRPLTELGQVQCRQLATILRQLNVGLERIITSPLLRAVQTAASLIEQGLAKELSVCEWLIPGARKRFLVDFLRDLGAGPLGVVGHEPHLSVFTAWLLGGKTAQLAFAKAGVARVEFPNRIGKGRGTLTWLVTPEWFPLLSPEAVEPAQTNQTEDQSLTQTPTQTSSPPLAPVQD